MDRSWRDDGLHCQELLFAGPNNIAYSATKADQAHQVRLRQRSSASMA